MNPDNKGPIIAMQIPIKNVVTSRKNEVEISARINVMAPIITIQTAMVRSIPHRDPNHTEKGAKMPMHNTGIVVRKLTAKLLMPRSKRMVSSKGDTEAIAGRRFAATKKNARIKKAFFV